MEEQFIELYRGGVTRDELKDMCNGNQDDISSTLVMSSVREDSPLAGIVPNTDNVCRGRWWTPNIFYARYMLEGRLNDDAIQNNRQTRYLVKCVVNVDDVVYLPLYSCSLDVNDFDAVILKKRCTPRVLMESDMPKLITFDVKNLTEEQIIDSARVLAWGDDNRIYNVLEESIELQLKMLSYQKTMLGRWIQSPYMKKYAPLVDFLMDRMKLSSNVHGLPHWIRVFEYGRDLAEDADVDAEVLRYFAFLHDSCRATDGDDPDHGARAADLIDEIRHDLLEQLNDDQVELLKMACTLHTGTDRTGNRTIDACLDSDRLDLWRVGISPDPARMATEKGAELARILNENKQNKN